MRLGVLLSLVLSLALASMVASQVPSQCVAPGTCSSDLSTSVRTSCDATTPNCCGKSFLIGLRLNSLFLIDPTNGQLFDSFFIVGLVQNDEVIIGMDIRPLTGQLYALSNFGRLYTIAVDPLSKVARATLVAQTTLNINPSLKYAVCINPQADRIRVISSANNNFRINPATGEVFTDADISLNGNNVSIAITACSYTNNVPNAASTQLYGLSSTLRSLVTVVPPNNPNAGVFDLVNSNNLLSGANIDPSIGFKIFTTSAGDIPYAVFAPSDTTQSPQLVRLDLATGAATPVANFPFPLDSLSVSPVLVCFCPFTSRTLTVSFNPVDGSLSCAA